MHHWNNISIKNEYETVLQCITKPPFSSCSSIQDWCRNSHLFLNCKQVSFLIEQDLHLNIAVTSLIWLTMLEFDNLKKWFIGSKCHFQAFCNNKIFFPTKAS